MKKFFNYAARFVFATFNVVLGRRTYRVAIVAPECFGKSTLIAAVLHALKQREDVEIEKVDTEVRDNEQRVPQGTFLPKTNSKPEGVVAQFMNGPNCYGPRIHFFVVPQERLASKVEIKRFIKPLRGAIGALLQNLFAKDRKTIIRALQGRCAELMDRPLEYTLEKAYFAAIRSLFDKTNAEKSHHVPELLRRAEAQTKLALINELLAQHPTARVQLAKDGASFQYKDGKVVVGVSQAELETDEASLPASSVVRELDELFQFGADLVQADHDKHKDKLKAAERQLPHLIKCFVRADQCRYVRGISSTLNDINVLAGARALHSHQTINVGNLDTALPTPDAKADLRLNHFDQKGASAFISSVLLTIEQIKNEERLPRQTWVHAPVLGALAVGLAFVLGVANPLTWLWMAGTGLGIGLAYGFASTENLRCNIRRLFDRVVTDVEFPEPIESAANQPALAAAANAAVLHAAAPNAAAAPVPPATGAPAAGAAAAAAAHIMAPINVPKAA